MAEVCIFVGYMKLLLSAIISAKRLCGGLLILLIGLTACKQTKVKHGESAPVPVTSFADLIAPGYVINADSIGQIIRTEFLPPEAGTACDSALVALYSQNGNFLWLGENGIQQADSLLYWLENSTRHGLNPERFAVSGIRSVIGKLPALKAEQEDGSHLLAELEYRLTTAYLDYACGLSYGFIRPGEVLNKLETDDDPKYRGTNRTKELYAIPLKQCDSLFIAEAIGGLREEPFEAFRRVQPSSPYYLKMQSELERLDALEDTVAGDIPLIGDTLLKEGDTHRVLPMIARRLFLTGELDVDTLAPDSVWMTLTPQLLEAVNRFRQNNRLPDDKSIGSYTIRFLNYPLRYYKDRLRINMERARWQYAQERGTKYVVANVAAFMLQAVNEEADSVLEMRICCGAAKTKTPLLSSKINYMELNPYWNVPQTIIRKEMIPAYRRDSTYFTRNRLKIYDKEGMQLNPHEIEWSKYKAGVPFSVKQDNRQGNSLGRIIFRFPNTFAVYLHDTPSRWAFTRTNRGVSHGCVRLEKALDFAFFLLKEPDAMLQDRIRLAMDIPPVTDEGKKLRRKENYKDLELKHYNLKERVPLFLDYQTVYMAPDGSLSYCEDTYKFDAPLLEALDAQNHK